MKGNNLKDLLSTEGSPSLKSTIIAVIVLAVPSIIEQIMVTFVQYVDTAMVGSLGADATASVGLTSSSIWLFNGILTAVSIGFSVQVAQYIGANDTDSAKSVVRQSLKFALYFGLIMATIGFTLSFFVPTWLGGEENIIGDSTKYLGTMSLFLPFNFIILLLSATLRCSGDTKTPMKLNLLINLLNVTFNFLLIYDSRYIDVFGMEIYVIGAGMGVAGAALGSGISLGVVGLLYLYLIFFKYKTLRVRFSESFKLQKKCLQAMLKLGIPVALERVVTCAAQLMLTALTASLGTVAIAANHLAVTAEAISYLPAFGVATAATTLVGQSMGAERKDVAIKSGRVANVIGVIMMSCGGIILFIFAEQLLTFFTPDPAVIDLGSDMLRIVAFAQPFFGLALVVSGSLRGAGDSKTPFIVSLITMWGIRILIAFTFAQTLGLAAIWIGMSLELAARGLILLGRFESKKWIKIRLLN